MIKASSISTIFKIYVRITYTAESNQQGHRPTLQLLDLPIIYLRFQIYARITNLAGTNQQGHRPTLQLLDLPIMRLHANKMLKLFNFIKMELLLLILINIW